MAEELLEKRTVNLLTNPATGEQVILGPAEDFEEKSFEDIIDDINNSDDFFDTTQELSEDDADKYYDSEDSIFGNNNFSEDTIKQVILLANRKIKKEKFNVYKELPDEVKDTIDKYISSSGKILANREVVNSYKNTVAEALLDEFIENIQLNKSKSDFATEMEQLYGRSIKELSEFTIEYTDERNKAYREATSKIEDLEKREKLTAILDQIDEARSLSGLKEFVKTSKIKRIELEKPEKRAYSGFTNKYVNSSNNIYDINLAKKILCRHLSGDGYTISDVDIFLISFCKQVRNYNVENPLEHAYMYYVMYYAAMLDGDKSDIFKNNVKEVINISKARNNLS